VSAEAMGLWLALGDAGIIVSVCYGPFGKGAPRWTVQAMGPDGTEFDLPFAAHDADHATAIAHAEAIRRGWIP
jgi:hypothetical protein